MSLGTVTSHHGRERDAILSALATESVNVSAQHMVSSNGDDDTLSTLAKGDKGRPDRRTSVSKQTRRLRKHMPNIPDADE